MIYSLNKTIKIHNINTKTTKSIPLNLREVLSFKCVFFDEHAFIITTGLIKYFFEQRKKSITMIWNCNEEKLEYQEDGAMFYNKISKSDYDVCTMFQDCERVNN